MIYTAILYHIFTYFCMFKKQRILPPQKWKTPRKHKKKHWPIGIFDLLSNLWKLGWGSQPDSWHILRTWEPLITSGAGSCGVPLSMGFCFLIHWPQRVNFWGREFWWVEFKGLQKPPMDMGVSKNNGWFIMENPMKMDGFGVSLFSETPIS